MEATIKPTPTLFDRFLEIEGRHDLTIAYNKPDITVVPNPIYDNEMDILAVANLVQARINSISLSKITDLNTLKSTQKGLCHLANRALRMRNGASARTAKKVTATDAMAVFGNKFALIQNRIKTLAISYTISSEEKAKFDNYLMVEGRLVEFMREQEDGGVRALVGCEVFMTNEE